MATIGERIKELREIHHLTMEEFGNRIGVQKSAVNKYEKGIVENLKRTTIEKICVTFDVTPQWLMGHSSYEMTLKVYTNLTDQDICTEEVRKIINKTRPLQGD